MTEPVEPQHTSTSFTRPFIICGECKEPVTGWHEPTDCALKPCTVGGYAVPCGHFAEVINACLTWDRDNGCQCLEQLGEVPHAV